MNRWHKILLFTLVLTLVGVGTIPPEPARANMTCDHIWRGKGIRNGFGKLVAGFVGHIEWCWNAKGRVTSGRFWTEVRRCCWWFWEGEKLPQDGGCFERCRFVSRYRMGSFIFNPPYPSTTTRYQPWFRLRASGDGSRSSSAGD